MAVMSWFPQPRPQPWGIPGRIMPFCRVAISWDWRKKQYQSCAESFLGLGGGSNCWDSFWVTNKIFYPTLAHPQKMGCLEDLAFPFWGERPSFRGKLAVGLMINNLCETPRWSLWWHLILRPIYFLWCKTRYHLGPFHGDVRKVSHLFGLNVSKICSTIQLCIDQWIEGQSYKHACILICAYIYIYIFWLISRFPQNPGPINLSKKKMDFSVWSPLPTWLLTAAAVFSGRVVVCWSLLMKQKRFYAVAAVRAMRMFKLPCSNLRFWSNRLYAEPNLDFGWERFHFCLPWKLFSSTMSVF